MKARRELIALQTIIVRESRRTIRVWMQSILPSLVTTILYFVIFGQVMGNRIGQMNGVSYIQYIAPGLIMMQIITGSYTGTVSGFFIAKFQRQIQELLVSSMSPLTIVLGFMISGMFRGIVIGMLVTAVALFFTHLHIYSLWIIFLITLSCAGLFSLAGLVNALFAKNFDDIAIVPTFILTPLTYLGGVFFSINLLPKSWQYISLFNPIAYIVNAFRFGILGIKDASIAVAFILILLFVFLLFIFAFYLIKNGMGLRE